MLQTDQTLANPQKLPCIPADNRGSNAAVLPNSAPNATSVCHSHMVRSHALASVTMSAEMPQSPILPDELKPPLYTSRVPHCARAHPMGSGGDWR
jgi:hypothetical protein